MNVTNFLISLLGPSILFASTAPAAVLIPAGVSVVTSVDLTAAGTSDWAAWHRGNNGEVLSASPTYRMNGGIATISAITTTNPSAITEPTEYKNVVRGTSSSNNYPKNVFTWTNAVAGTAAPDHLTGIFHATLRQSLYGVQFSISNLPLLTEGQHYRINVYGTSYNGSSSITLTSGSLNATLNGASKGSGNNDKTTNLFAFDYNPDSASNSLLVTLISNGTVTNAHAPIQAVAISIIPEPSSAILPVFGGIALATLRRRRKA